MVSTCEQHREDDGSNANCRCTGTVSGACREQTLVSFVANLLSGEQQVMQEALKHSSNSVETVKSGSTVQLVVHLAAFHPKHHYPKLLLWMRTSYFCISHELLLCVEQKLLERKSS